jgi:hypothetical protein
MDFQFAKLIAIAGLIAMTVALVFGFTAGDFQEDGAEILKNPWGIVSLVDLYTGFILFSGWIAFREKTILRTVLWIAAMLVLGFFAGSLYTLLALLGSGGDWRRFWMGHRAYA